MNQQEKMYYERICEHDLITFIKHRYCGSPILLFLQALLFDIKILLL